MAKRAGKAIKRPSSKQPSTDISRRKPVTKVKFPTCGDMSKVLTFGRRSNPTCIVVMLHGLNDSAASCSESVAMKWARGLRGSLVVVPQSPDLSIWSSKNELGYDWLRQEGYQNTEDDEANVRELQRVARVRARHVETWLKALLRKYDVRKDRLVITGFSQGSILAALCSVRMNALAAIICGGVTGQPVYSAKTGDYVGGGWMRWEELLPKGRRATKFCAINGTRDSYVPRRLLEKMLESFDCEWHWDQGVGHDFPDRWYATALRWMKHVLR